MKRWMKGALLVLALAVLMLMVASCGHHHRMQGAKCPNCPMMKGVAAAPAAMAGEKAAMRQDLVYLCDCGPDCKCGAVGTQPGNCACGKAMRGYHVVKIEGDEALLCTCGPQCSCAIDPKDPAKCGCGQPVKRVSLKGTGLYFCNCGGSCTCNTVATQPGNCRCGMPLKQVN